MNIWLVSMECAGLAEAGGVKNVTYSLCQSFAKLGHNVTLFIPVYACSDFSSVENLVENAVPNVTVKVGNSFENINYSTACFKNSKVKIVFVNHPSFAEKHAVYVYTEEEHQMNPLHQRGSGHVDTLFLDALLSKAVVKYGEYIVQDALPDIVHCQDASTAVVPSYINQRRTLYTKTKSVVTIHNAGPAYHHEYCDVSQAKYYTDLPDSLLVKAMNQNRVEPFLLAAIDGHLSTVSTFYAKELVSPDFDRETDGLSGIFYRNKIKVTGITNGIDYDRYNPEFTEVSLLPFEMNPIKQEFSGKFSNRKFFLELCRNDFPYTPQHESFLTEVKRYGSLVKETPEFNPVYFMFHGRIVWQKGISILIPAIKSILSRYINVRFVVEGQGDIYFENQLIQLSNDFYGRMVFFQGYNRALSRLVAASADFALFPSFFEPCGLEDFIAQIYGTIPLAHATGGLCKIIDGKTGYTYKENTEQELISNIEKLVNLKNTNRPAMDEMVKNAASHVKNEYDWLKVAEKKYLKFFKNI